MVAEVGKEESVLVEFTTGPGFKKTSLTSSEVAEKSRLALDQSMGVIKAMGRRISDLRDDMPQGPDEVTIQFAIKFDAEAGAVIAKSGVEAGLNLILVWKK